MTTTQPETTTEESPTSAESEQRWRSSYSAVSQWRACPQRWNYDRLLRLEKVPNPDDPPVVRDFGSWWHALRAAESLERGRSLGSLRSVPERLRTTDDGPTFDATTVEVETVLAGAAEFHRVLSSDSRYAWTNTLGEDLPDRLEHLLASWREEWAEDIAHEAPLAVELSWKRSLPKVGGRDTGMDLVGFCDEVYLDTRRNIVVVRDDKTSKSLAARTALDDMMDSQLQLYAWGITPTVGDWGLGRIGATSYDRACSVKPTTPVLTKAGALSKSVTRYDLNTYLRWAKEVGHEPVPSVVERLSSPATRSQWFQRTLVPINANVVRTHLRAAVDTAFGMSETRKRAQVSGSAARNLGQACRWCDFASLCRAQMMGGDDGEYDLAAHGLRKRATYSR